MITVDEVRGLTERQREVLAIVVENKLFKNRDTQIPELSEMLGIAPEAVYRHLIKAEENELVSVVISPSEKGTRIYERLRLEPTKPARMTTTEALSESKKAILEFLARNPDCTVVELSEELGLSEPGLYNHLRVLEVLQLVSKEKSRAIRRGVPPHIYNITMQGRAIIKQLDDGSVA
jgi:predicted ArsR family transcriptional regulator